MVQERKTTLSVKVYPELKRRFDEFCGDRSRSEVLREIVIAAIESEAEERGEQQLEPSGPDRGEILERMRALADQRRQGVTVTSIPGLMEVGEALLWDLVELSSRDYWALEKFAEEGGRIPRSLLDPKVVIDMIKELRQQVTALEKHAGLMTKEEVYREMERVLSILGAQIDIVLKLRVAEWQPVAEELKGKMTAALEG